MTLPMTPDNLSTTMYDALNICRTRGALIYIVGGWWTYPDCPMVGGLSGVDVPLWHVTRGTITALLRRNLIVVALKDKVSRHLRVEPVPTADWAPPPKAPT